MSAQVTIIVPIYNVSRYIERCASSLFEQSLESIEFIFVNDCTTDDSVEILKSIVEKFPTRKSQVKLIEHNCNRGLAAARNTGLRASSGDYIIHIDSDDYVELNMIELLYQQAVWENADIVACDFYLDWGKAKKVWKQDFFDSAKEYTKAILSAKLIPSLWAKLIRRELYFDNDIFGFESIDMGEDYVLATRLCYVAKKISKVHLPLYYYNQMNANAFAKIWSNSNIQNIIDGLRIVEDYFLSQLDYSEYKASIEEGKVRKKIELFRRTKLENLQLISEGIFTSSEAVKSISLSTHQKVLYTLGTNNQKFLLLTYIFSYKLLVEINQRLKGRK
jgi:glycosyltransferase involved in cell wall biosynthesis